MTAARPQDPIIALGSGAALHPLVLPAPADAGAPGPLREYADVRNRCLAEASGRTDDELSLADAEDAVTQQNDTLVLAGHRGHRSACS